MWLHLYHSTIYEDENDQNNNTETRTDSRTQKAFYYLYNKIQQTHTMYIYINTVCAWQAHWVWIGLSKQTSLGVVYSSQPKATKAGRWMYTHLQYSNLPYSFCLSPLQSLLHFIKKYPFQSVDPGDNSAS